jgi:hypothetical protein
MLHGQTPLVAAAGFGVRDILVSVDCEGSWPNFAIVQIPEVSDKAS